MNLYESMRHFTTVVEKGSFTKAADTLDVSTVAVSKQISQLENHLKITLFERSTRNLKLTTAGQTFYDHAKKNLVLLDEFLSLGDRCNQNPSGDLKIHASFMVGNYLLIPYLREFSEKYPDINISLYLSDTLPNLYVEDYDMSIGFSQSVSGDLHPDTIAVPLLKLKKIFVASPQYLEKNGMPNNSKDLADHTYLYHVTFKKDYLLHRLKVPPKKIFYFNDSLALFRAALHGLGIAYAWDFIVEKEIQDNHLVKIFPKCESEEIQTFIYHKHLNFLPSKVEAFKNFILEKIKTTERTLFVL